MFRSLSNSSTPEGDSETQAKATVKKAINPFDIFEVEEAGEGSYPVPSIITTKSKAPARYTMPCLM